MNGRIKRFWTGLLCAAMIITSMPVQVFAVDSSNETLSAEVEILNETLPEDQGHNEITDTVTDGSHQNNSGEEIEIRTGEEEATGNETMPGDLVEDEQKDAAEPSENAYDAAETETSGDYEYQKVGDLDVKLTKYTGSETSISIPASIEGFTVKTLGNGLFKNNTGITHVEIPSSVTGIESYAFYGCSSLKSITIPKNVESIASNNFGSLESITFESGMTKIPDYSLYQASKLTTVNIPYSVTAIGNYAFYNCKLLETVSLPANLKSIGSYAFEYCEKLNSISLPNKLESIGAQAFYDCTGIKDITIPKSVTSIGSNAFNCVETAAFESGITNIPDNAFNGAAKLNTVTIPSTVTAIGTYAFANCSILSEASLPARLEKIGNSAFSNSMALKSVSIPSGCEVDSYAFSGCTSVKSITIGNNVTLGSRVFNGCSSVEKVDIGDDLTKESDSFAGIKIIGSGDGMAWSIDLDKGTLEISGSGVAHDYTADERAPWSGIGSLISNIVIRENFTTIGDYFFYGMNNITAITIPETIRSIGQYSFYGCTELRYIEIPDSVKTIYDYAFGGCTGVKEVVFCGNAPVFKNACFPQDNIYTVYYPEKSTGWVEHIKKKFSGATIKTWDNTAPTKDVVLVLDRSGSMSGRMEKLKEASNTFVNEIGGRVHNTRIAVISYDDSTTVESTFSTDRIMLNERIDQLYDRGGTEYLKALNAAETVLQTSEADYKFLIMFSDGEPNDNKNNIYQKAEQMQQEYMMYSVGLGNSASQREVLVNVAGDESRYFEATNIEALIQAFLDLASNLGRGAETKVSIKRNESRRDLLEDYEAFCVGSDEKIVIDAVVSNKAVNVTSVGLMQSGKVVMTSRTGNFGEIMPGKLFTAVGEPVYLVVYNASNKIIEKIELGIDMREYFVATYLMNDGTNRIYAEQHVLNGKELVAPEGINGTKGVPEREGYAFKGWFTTEQCIGSPFYSDEMQAERYALEDDIVLYAKWKNSTGNFEIEQDGWSFLNNDNPFYCYDKEITTGDYAKLVAGINENDATSVQEYKDSAWNGSCFGMSSSACLIKDGIIYLSKFDPNYTEPGDVETLYHNTNGDADVSAVESMINYYHLRQLIGNIDNARRASDNESENIEKILSKMSRSNKPVVLGLGLNEADGSSAGGHAVVAYNLKDNGDGTYSFKVYDCSMGNTKFPNYYNSMEHSIEYDVNISLSGDTYTKSCSDWETAWGYGIFLKYALDIDDLLSERILLAPDVVNTMAESDAPNAAEYELRTSYPSFTIFNGTVSATIEKGKKTAGELNIKCYGNQSEIGEEPSYLFDIPVLSAGTQYTITQTSGAAKYHTVVDYSDKTKGFYSSVRSTYAGVVIVGSDGSIRTSYSSSTAQTINVTRNDLNTDWYNTRLEGSSSSFEIGIRENKTYISSAIATTAKIEVNNVFNKLTFDNVQLDSTPVTIEKNANGDCVIVKSGSEIKNAGSFGYSVVFDSQCGTSVSSNTNVRAGSTVNEPDDPTREGYVFEGWFKEAECSNRWDFDKDTVNKDTILYAGWSINSGYYVSVTFKVPGDNDKSIYTRKGSELKSADCPVNIYDSSNVWYKDADYTAVWDHINDRVDKDYVLYGKGRECTIDYVTSCAASISSNTVYAGRKINVPLTVSGNELIRDGYTLVGWSTDPEGDYIWNFKTDRVYDSMTLYACWIENEKDSSGKDTGICIEITNKGYLVYTGNAIIPSITVMDKGKKLTEGVDYKVSYKNNVNACSISDNSVSDSKKPQIVVNGIGAYKSGKKFIKYFTIKPVNADALKISVPSAVIAKSNNALQQLKPEVKIRNKKVAGKDYVLVYKKDSLSSNAVSGLSTPGKYYVAIEGKKNGSAYTGNIAGVSAYQEVLVVDKSVAVMSAKVTKITKSAYDNIMTQEQAIKTLISKVVLNGTTYTTADYNNFVKYFVITATDENGKHVSQKNIADIFASTGVKTIKLSAVTGNDKSYAGDQTWKLTITGTSLKTNQFTLTYDRNAKKPVTKTTYTGSSMKPAILTALKEGRDYSITYMSGKNILPDSQLINAGKYTAAIVGKGAYSGTIKLNFTIDKANIAKAYTAGLLRVYSSASSMTFETGGAMPTIAISYDADGMNSYEYDRISLIAGSDFALSYSNNKKPTSYRKLAYATIKGKGNFTGTLKGDGKTTGNARSGIARELNFSITSKRLDSDDIRLSVTGLKKKNGKVSKVLVVLYDGNKKIASGEYSVGRPSNSGGYTNVYVSGRGKKYSGSRYVYIKDDAISVADTRNVKITLSENSVYYNGEQQKPGVAIRDAQGTDITDKFKISYGENVNIGNGTVIIEGVTEEGSGSSEKYISIGRKELKFKILPKWAKWVF